MFSSSGKLLPCRPTPQLSKKDSEKGGPWVQDPEASFYILVVSHYDGS